jgi:hypothetical protein
MTIAAGYFGLTLEKQLIDTAGWSLESETLNKTQLLTDAYTPNFDTHNFRDDFGANEPGNSGTYTAGGTVLTTTELTVGSPAATQMKWTADNLSWTGATLTAYGTGTYHVTGGASSTDEVICVNIFGGAVSSVAGTFTVSWHATNGIFYVDYA